MEKYNKETKMIWCPTCGVWRSIRNEVYTLNNEIRCLFDDIDNNHGTLLGYTEDIRDIFETPEDTE